MLTKDRFIIPMELELPDIPMESESSYGGLSNSHSVSGEMVSFVTDIPYHLGDLKVAINAVQDGEPWIDSDKDTAPYLFRAMSSVDVPRIGNRETDKLIGGSVAWNQLVKKFTERTETGNGLTVQFGSDGSITIDGTATDSGNVAIMSLSASNGTLISNHVYYVFASPKNGSPTTYYGGIAGLCIDTGNGGLFKHTYSWSATSLRFDYKTGAVLSNAKIYPQHIDLTQMFGTTIADYIYNLEQSTAGAGVAFFKKYFPKDYYPYNEGEMLHVQTSEFKTVGFNQWDEEWERGYYKADGTKDSSNGNIRCTNRIPVFANTTYYCKTPYAYGLRMYSLDSSGMVIADLGYINNNTFTTPSNSKYLVFYTNAADNVTTYNGGICINLHWDGTRDGEYEPYTEHSYPLDDSLELRGIPKLDADNNLYFDGDTYEHDGTVTRKYGIVDLGTLTWTYSSGLGGFYANVSGKANTTQECNVRCEKYASLNNNGPDSSVFSSMPDKSITGFYNPSSANSWVYVKDSAYTDASTFKTAMSGVYLVYELATSTTETAESYQTPQIVDNWGTEEFVVPTQSGVEIPVGHESTYSHVAEIIGWTGANVFVRGINQWDEEWEVGTLDTSNGTTTGNNNRIRTKNFVQILPQTQYCYYSGTDEGLTDNKRYTFRRCYYDKNKNFISGDAYFPSGGSSFTMPYVFTTPENAYYMKFSPSSAYGATYNHDISINYPSTDTDYHAYIGTTYSVTWETEAGTVYGGTLDVTTGELVVTWVRETLDGTKSPLITDWRSYAGQSAWLYDLNAFNVVKSDNVGHIISDSLPNITYSSIYTGTIGVCTMSAANYSIAVRVNVDGLTTKELINAYLANNPIEIVYELATPQTYQLTPTEVMALLGQNNVWADCGDIENLVYFTIDEIEEE